MMQKIEEKISEFFGYLDKLGSTKNLIVGLACTILIGIVDSRMPDGYMLSFFYLLPIALTTWFAGKGAGVLVSLLCTCLLYPYYLKLDLLPSVWNILSTLGVFLIVTLMQDKIHELLKIESELARIDPLTGVINQRAFLELVGYEMLRLQRESIPFSLVYLDIDNFKAVNDQFGHIKGDELLKSVAACLLENHRKSDIVARMGGDEFTIFFPGTDTETVKVAIERIRKFLNELSEKNNWPTTISMGVVTCTTGNCELNNVVTMADNLMYKVKNTGKDNVIYSEYFSNEEM